MSNWRRFEDSDEEEQQRLQREREQQEREDEERRMQLNRFRRRRNQLNSNMLHAVAAIEPSNQQASGSRPGRRPNLNRKRGERGENLLEDYFIPNSLYPEGFFRTRFRMRPHLFNKIMVAICNHDNYFVQKIDAANVMGLLPEQKITAALRMLAYGQSADSVDEICRMAKSTVLEALGRFCSAIEELYTAEYLRRPTPADLQRLLQKGESRGFPGMIGSIDCMHWQWKNCPTAWHGAYGNRKGTKSIILEAVASFDTWIWHAFFGVPGAQNDLNVLGQSPVFDDLLRGASPQITYEINDRVYSGAYYLADGIYPSWNTFVKTAPNPHSKKQKYFASMQEGYRKDVERCFGILQARWGIVRGAARLFDDGALRSIMMTCIILHNMIVEDEYDYDMEEPLDEDPLNNSRTRIYSAHENTNDPANHDPIERNPRYHEMVIQRYHTMHSSFLHKERQRDLMEHIWARKDATNE